MTSESGSIPALDVPWDIDDEATPVAPSDPNIPTPQTDLMAEALAWLTLAGIGHYKASDHQVKINTLSYYPVRGTMNYDQQKKLVGRGLDALRSHLQTALRRDLPPLA